MLSPDLRFRVCNFGFIPFPLLASVRVEENEAREAVTCQDQTREVNVELGSKAGPFEMVGLKTPLGGHDESSPLGPALAHVF